MAANDEKDELVVSFTSVFLQKVQRVGACRGSECNKRAASTAAGRTRKRAAVRDFAFTDLGA
jgi:hypothetical protein